VKSAEQDLKKWHCKYTHFPTTIFYPEKKKTTPLPHEYAVPNHYDIYQNMHSNEEVREAVRKEQLQEYVKSHNLAVRYYQDFGWPAVEL
jgi:hypothetical protein